MNQNQNQYYGNITNVNQMSQYQQQLYMQNYYNMVAQYQKMYGGTGTTTEGQGTVNYDLNNLQTQNCIINIIMLDDVNQVYDPNLLYQQYQQGGGNVDYSNFYNQYQNINSNYGDTSSPSQTNNTLTQGGSTVNNQTVQNSTTTSNTETGI